MGHFKKNALGGFVSSVNLFIIEMLTVGMPDFSISLCISPTDRLQIAHPGVRITAVTPSAFKRDATSGAVFLSNAARFLPAICPINP